MANERDSSGGEQEVASTTQIKRADSNTTASPSPTLSIASLIPRVVGSSTQHVLAAEARLMHLRGTDPLQTDEAQINLKRDTKALFKHFMEGFSEMSRSLSELLTWKDEVLSIYKLPAASLTALAILSSELYRSKTQLTHMLTSLMSAVANITVSTVRYDEAGNRGSTHVGKGSKSLSTGALSPTGEVLPSLEEETPEEEDTQPASRNWVIIAALVRGKLDSMLIKRVMFGRAEAERDVMRAFALFYTGMGKRPGGATSPTRTPFHLPRISRGGGPTSPLRSRRSPSRRSPLRSRGSRGGDQERLSTAGTSPPVFTFALDSGPSTPERLPMLPNPPSRGDHVSLGLLPTKELVRMTSRSSKEVHEKERSRRELAGMLE